MIQHTVAFTLNHAAGSAAETDFLDAADVLADIPGVQNFEKLRQTSGKTDFAFGFSMNFANQAAYDGYNDHPWHVAFVRDRWASEVNRFMELDYVRL